MTDADEVLGPIDYMVVEYPPGQREFDPETARELASLIEAELIRVLDVVVLELGGDGRVEVFEVEDMSDDSPLALFRGRLAEVFAAADIATMARVMVPGTTAAVLMLEQRWAGPLMELAGRWGAQVIAGGRIPTEAFVNAIGPGDLADRP